jgi:endophilin-A
MQNKAGTEFTFFASYELDCLVAGTKLAEDCCKYGLEGPNSTGALARASNILGTAVLQMEKEREMLHRSLGTQVTFNI